MITRRVAIGSGVAALAAPATGVLTRAQGHESARVVFLTIAPAGGAGDALAVELDRCGREKGIKIDLVRLNAGGRVEALPTLAGEAVRLNPRVVVVFASHPTRAMQQATSTIPIVAVGDLLQEGLIAGLARPGANTTGVNLLTRDLDLKKMEVLREMLPGAMRLGMLNYIASREPEKLRQLGERLRLDIREQDAHTPDDFDPIFARFRLQDVRAVVVANTSFFSQMRGDLIAAARRHGIALVCEWPQMAEAGCLASYGYVQKEFNEIAADYVVRILTGASPGTLPVVEPTRFQLVVNQRMARELGLTVAPAILARADEVIE